MINDYIAEIQADIEEEFYELLYAAQKEVLNEREQRIFSERFGLENGIKTLEEIGREEKVSRERIRQIIKKCINKIKGKRNFALRKKICDNPCLHLINFLEDNFATFCGKYKENHNVGLDSILYFFMSVPYQITWLILRLLFSKNIDEITKFIINAINHAKKVEQEERIKELKQKKSDGKASFFLEKISWPSKPHLITDEEISKLSRERNVNPENNSGVVFSQKSKKEVQYESVLEMHFMNIMENSNDVLLYQEQPFRLSWDKYVYYPDIFVILKDRRAFIVEIKPLLGMAIKHNILKFRTLWKFCSKNGYGMLVTDCRTSFMDLLERSIPRDYETDILQYISTKPMALSKYKEIKNNYKVKTIDFVSLVIQNKLIWTSFPFLLQYPL